MGVNIPNELVVEKGDTLFFLPTAILYKLAGDGPKLYLERILFYISILSYY